MHQCTTRGGSVSQPCLCRTEPQSPGGGSGWAFGETQQQSGPGSGQQLVQKVIQEQGSDAFPLVAQVEYGEVLTVPLMSMPLRAANRTRVSSQPCARVSRKELNARHAGVEPGSVGGRGRGRRGYQLKCGVPFAGIMEWLPIM